MRCTYTHSMAINVANCLAHPTCVSFGPWAGGAFPFTPLGNHRVYTAAACRVTLHPAPSAHIGLRGITALRPAVDPAGDTYFLPFSANQICSMVLPIPVAGAPQSFLTADMDGCRVFVDRVSPPIVPGAAAVPPGAPESLVIYHVNNIANSPPPGAPVNLEIPACTAQLTALRTLARADLAAAPYNLILIASGSISKPAYLAGAHAEEMRKAADHRTGIEFMGGTMVFGHVNAGHWEIYWTTYGDFEYHRPAKAPLGWFGHRHRQPNHPEVRMNRVTNNYRMLGSGRIHP